MAGALNKRQQARNERVLQDLIKTVPGNDRCADCGARNPGWASWSLGVFLCVRCASLHRKVGTHITKIKSLSMDSWSNEQVETMKRTGNVASNRIFNPRSVKASLPVDADEVNGAMERYIRQKYEQRKFTTDAPPAPRQFTGTTSTSTGSDDAPVLPPKPRKSFFGLRSTSSVLPSRRERISPPISPGRDSSGRESPPLRVNKASKIFGAVVGSSSSESFDVKLAQLRDMGFPDGRRNSQVLKAVDGNIDRAIETLIRLGAERSRSPSRTESPAVPPKDDQYVVGLSVPKRAWSVTSTPLTHTPAAIATINPFDALDQEERLHAQRAQQAQQHANSFPMPGAGMNAQPWRSFTTPNAYNPFVGQQQAQQLQPQPPLDQSFQALSLTGAQAPQQLFPNATGGYGNAAQQQSNPFYQTYSPPPVATYQPPILPPLNTQLQLNGQLQEQFEQFEQQQQQQLLLHPNPFLRHTRSQNFTPSANSDPFGLSPSQLEALNPFGPAVQQSPAQQLLQPSFTSPPELHPYAPHQSQMQSPQQSQQQYNPFSQPQPLNQPQQSPQYGYPPASLIQPQPQQQQQLHNNQQQPTQPFPQTTTQQAPQQPHHPFHQQPNQPPPPPQPFRHDKASILALYNMPHLAPIPTPPSPAPPSGCEPGGSPTAGPRSQHQQSAAYTPQRSVTMPISTHPAPAPPPPPGTLNPFSGAGALASVAENAEAANANGVAANGAVAYAGAARGLAAGSRESVDFMGFGAGMGGRMSPDAFAGLSARPFVS